MPISKETRNIPEANNAREKFLTAEQFFAQSAEGTPESFIQGHEEWLKNLLQESGTPIDNRTWTHFYNSAIGASIGYKGPSLRTIEKNTYQSVGDILQALAWHCAPENASWKSPALVFQVSQDIFWSQWNDTMPASYRFTRNLHHSSRDLWKGSLTLVSDDGDDKMRNLSFSYHPRQGMLTLDFSNPNDFMGWKKDGAQLIYRLKVLHQVLTDVTERLKKKETGFIEVVDWKAY